MFFFVYFHFKQCGYLPQVYENILDHYHVEYCSCYCYCSIISQLFLQHHELPYPWPLKLRLLPEKDNLHIQ